MQEVVTSISEQAASLSQFERDMMLIMETNGGADYARVFVHLRDYFPKYQGNVDPLETIRGVDGLVQMGLVENVASDHAFGNFRLTDQGRELRGLKASKP